MKQNMKTKGRDNCDCGFQNGCTRCNPKLKKEQLERIKKELKK